MTIAENKWQLFFDGAANKRGYGIGMLLVDPANLYTPLAIRLDFEATNNTTEYEACIAGLEAALERNVTELEVYGDSQLIIFQSLKKWKILDPTLQKYNEHLQDLVKQFKEVTFYYLPRDKNRFADSLAMLASLVEIPEWNETKTFRVTRRTTPAYSSLLDLHDCKEPGNTACVNTLDRKPWYYDVWSFLLDGTFPSDASPKAKIALDG